MPTRAVLDKEGSESVQSKAAKAVSKEWTKAIMERDAAIVRAEKAEDSLRAREIECDTLASLALEAEARAELAEAALARRTR